MSEPLSLRAAKQDPAAFLARLRQAAQLPLYLAGVPDPPVKGAGKHRRHVVIDDVQFLESLGDGALLLHLRDGDRIRSEGATLGQVLKKLVAGGYRFLKPHRQAAVRVERIAGVAIDREAVSAPAPHASSNAIDLDSAAYEIVVDEHGNRSLRSYAPALLKLPAEARKLEGLGISAVIMAARRYRLRFGGTDATSPIGGGNTEAKVIAALAPYTSPPLTRFDRTEPESRQVALEREQGLVTVGGPAFWALAMNPEKTEEERKAWVDQWMIRHLPLEDAAKLFRFATQPQVEEGDDLELQDWIDKSEAIRNVVWQVHQWLQWGIIDAIIRDDDDDDDDWWDPDPESPPVARTFADDDNDDEDQDANKPNVRTLWYRYGKGTLKNWEIYRQKDDEVFDHIITTMARRLGLCRYEDFGFKDTLRKSRGLGATRPHLLVVTEKDTMEGLTLRMAKRIGGSHLVLSGEPPKITMEYLTTELLEVLKAKGPLEKQEVHIFGLVDYNAAGSNILESVREDIEHYGRYVDEKGKERKLKAVHAHTLIYSQDMSDELVESKRTAQIHYKEEWVYVGNKRLRAKVFEPGAGNVSRLTLVSEWYRDVVNDTRFHRKVKREGGLVEEWYYGLEVDDHPPARLKKRFKEIVTKLKLLR